MKIRSKISKSNFTLKKCLKFPINENIWSNKALGVISNELSGDNRHLIQNKITYGLLLPSRQLGYLTKNSRIGFCKSTNHSTK